MPKRPPKKSPSSVKASSSAKSSEDETKGKPASLPAPPAALSGHGETEAGRPAQAQKHQLAKIRHELRTPINHIIGYSEMLAEEAGERIPKALLDDLVKIHRGGDRLLVLISEYFDDEKFFSEQHDLRQIYHELRTPVNAIIGYAELLQEEASERKLNYLIPDLRKIKKAAEDWMVLMDKYLVDPRFFGDHQPSIIQPNSPADIDLAALVPKSLQLSARDTGRILVVDDDQTNREMLSRRLSRQGYSVVTAENGEQALKKLRTGQFDLALLDMIMPGMDGHEVLQKIKASKSLRHLPVIMISALDQVEGIVRCIEMGAEDYLSKPFNPVFLRARIGAALEKKRLRDKEQLYLRQLNDERLKSEQLLLNVLPHAIAERLKKGETAIVDSYNEVSVLFADLVGFTSLSLHIAHKEVVHLLNEIFSAFDLLARKHGLEKIKTIGDAYMAAAGLPSPRADHAAAAAELALDMQTEIDSFNTGYRTSLRMRIGINSGPVIAGIIGRNKFIYDLWGDTVNTASRMESHGRPGAIQVTEMTRDLIEADYVLRKRGNIEVKGKGQMSTYFLVGRKPRCLCH